MYLVGVYRCNLVVPRCSYRTLLALVAVSHAVSPSPMFIRQRHNTNVQCIHRSDFVASFAWFDVANFRTLTSVTTVSDNHVFRDFTIFTYHSPATCTCTGSLSSHLGSCASCHCQLQSPVRTDTYSKGITVKTYTRSYDLTTCSTNNIDTR